MEEELTLMFCYVQHFSNHGLSPPSIFRNSNVRDQRNKGKIGSRQPMIVNKMRITSRSSTFGNGN